MEDLMLIEILKELQKKYQHIVEIERITREMGDSLSRNDRTSVQMQISMRQDEMDNADNCDKKIRILLAAVPLAEADSIRKWMKGNNTVIPDSAAAEKIFEKGSWIQAALKRTIDIDRHICTRLAGSNSFYK